MIQDGLVLRYASKEMKNDKDIVLAAVTQDITIFGRALEYASARLKVDIKIIDAALLCSWQSK